MYLPLLDGCIKKPSFWNKLIFPMTWTAWKPLKTLFHCYSFINISSNCNFLCSWVAWQVLLSLWIFVYKEINHWVELQTPVFYCKEAWRNKSNHQYLLQRKTYLAVIWNWACTKDKKYLSLDFTKILVIKMLVEGFQI